MAPPKGFIPWNKGLVGFGKFNKGKKRSAETREKIGDSRRGRKRPGNPKNWKHTEMTKQKISESQKGIRKSPKTEFKKGNVPWNKGLKGFNSRKNHYKWKGGLSSKANKIRTSTEMRLWRNAVYARDNWTCQDCGDDSGGNLNAHHIKSFAKYPRLRFAIDNGVTLCLTCHKKTKSYGVNKNG
ncbi:MAG: HNH endonuclease [Candidatus Heimdallarchaeota archaeon]